MIKPQQKVILPAALQPAALRPSLACCRILLLATCWPRDPRFAAADFISGPSWGFCSSPRLAIMRSSLGIVSWLFHGILSVAAAAKSNDEEPLCLRSCRNCLQSVRFADSLSTAPGPSPSCRSRLSLSSLYLCLRLNCHPDARTPALNALYDSCQPDSSSPTPPWTAVANFTSDEIERVPRLGRKDVLHLGHPLSEVALPSLEFYSLWFDTLVSIWSFATSRHPVHPSPVTYRLLSSRRTLRIMFKSTTACTGKTGQPIIANRPLRLPST